MQENFKFEVGATYQNMKGAYEVISIQGGAMVIRWSDGSEAATTVDLQMRILERMAFEKAENEQLSNATLTKKSRKAKQNTTE